MILRRVIEHVRAQNWTAVALDFVIVVIALGDIIFPTSPRLMGCRKESARV